VCINSNEELVLKIHKTGRSLIKLSQMIKTISKIEIKECKAPSLQV